MLESRKLQVRGGNSGAVVDGNVIADTGESCIRKILLRHHGVEEKNDARTEKIFDLGHANEEYFERDYLQDKTTFEREVAISEDVTDAVEFVGHSDYVTPEYVYELKSATSKYSRAKYITGGTPKISNVCQLVRYMISLQRTFGILAYTYYEEVDGKFQQIDHRQYLISIQIDGTIFVDNNEQLFKAQDVAAHTELSAKYLTKNEIYPERPTNLEGEIGCKFCKFNDLCEQWAHVRFDSAEFVKRAKEIVK